MNVKIHQIMGDHESYSWSCLNCGLPNFCTSLFENSISFMESSNSFFVLDDSLTPTTSTPAKLSKHFAKKLIPRKLKILNLNLQSIVNKVQEFHCLLDIENPDIVVGTESWLRSDIANSEVFPQGYSVFRADRASRGGGVFILVRRGLLCTEQPQFRTECEILWVKLEITGSRPLYIGGFYRPEEDDLEGLQELQKSISKVMEHSDNVWVLSDFNLPKLQWPDCEPLIKPDCSCKQVYDYFIEILDDNNLTQVVTQPTRLNNTLDLFLTTNPTLIKEVKCQPGLADHDMVSAESLLKPTTHKPKPRKTFIFKKADWPALKLKLKQFQESFIKSSPGKSVEVLWHDFTSTLNKLREECIPSKHIQGKSSLPWITQGIKRLIRKRDSLYTQYKKKGDQTVHDQFQALRQKIKKKIKTTYNGYLNDLLGLSENNKTCDRKKLFSFLKNSRRDQEGIPPLKENDTLFTGRCIPWTKSTWTAGLGPVQVNIRWTKQGIPWTR